MDAEQVNATDDTNAGITAAAFPLTVGDACGIHGRREAEAKGPMRMGAALGDPAEHVASVPETAPAAE